MLGALHNPKARNVIYESAADNEEEKTPIPPAIKHERNGGDKRPFSIIFSLGKGPNQEKQQRENNEFERIKNHNCAAKSSDRGGWTKALNSMNISSLWDFHIRFLT